MERPQALQEEAEEEAAVETPAQAEDEAAAVREAALWLQWLHLRLEEEDLRLTERCVAERLLYGASPLLVAAYENVLLPASAAD